MSSTQPESVQRPLSVALVVRRYDHAWGGAERWTHEHAVWLLRAGCKVMIVAERITGAPAGAEPHVVTVVSPWYRHPSWDFAAAAAAVVEQLNPDVTVDMGCSWCGDVVIPHYGTRGANDRARLALRAPVQRALRAFYTAVLPRRRRLAALERRVMAGAERVVAISSMTSAHLTADVGVDPSRIDVVPNGVDLVRFKPPGEHERLEARRTLAVGDSPVVLLIAHDFRLKGVSTAVRAVAALHHQRGPGKKDAPLLLVVGRDPARPVEKLAARLGIAHLVRVEGSRDDVRPYLYAADVLVHPTFYDPCGLVALEAVACGLPVIISANAGAVEQLRVGRECLVLADAADVQGLAGLIERALEPACNRAMRADALSQRPRLDAEVPANHLLALYRRIRFARDAAAADPTVATPHRRDDGRGAAAANR